MKLGETDACLVLDICRVLFTEMGLECWGRWEVRPGGHPREMRRVCNCTQESEAWGELLGWRCRPGVLHTLVRVKARAWGPSPGGLGGGGGGQEDPKGSGQRRDMMRRTERLMKTNSRQESSVIKTTSDVSR